MVRLINPTVRSVDVRVAAPARKFVDPFYSTPEWRDLVAKLIKERGRVCEDPRCDGATHAPGMRVFGDHLVELQDGGAPLDEANVMLRCGASHSRKTAATRAERTRRRPG